MIHLMGMWWPPHESLPAALHAAMFLILAASTLYFFLQALLEGPGFVPSGWKPVSAKHVFIVLRKRHCDVVHQYIQQLLVQ